MPKFFSLRERRAPRWPAALSALFLLGTGGALLAGCLSPAPPPNLDPESLSLLRLEYLERSARLPAMNIDRVDLPQVDYLGRFSPVLWKIRTAELPQRELLRPLPIENPDLRLRDTLSRTFEEFGFTMRGWPGRPALRMRVEVERLLLLSENGHTDRRACELHLLMRIEENLSGLEVTRYRCRTRSELPGSWLALREGFPQWIPSANEPDPFERAVAEAARQFLVQSVEFWKDPGNWEGVGLKLSGRNSAGPFAPPTS